MRNSPSVGNKIDTLWQTTRWLRSCEEDEPIWWPLICPLTDGSDVATLALAWQLMAAWRWAVTVSTPPICPPAPMVMNIGQFLVEDITGMDGVCSNGWRLTLMCSSMLGKLQKAGAGNLRVKALPPRSHCSWRLSSVSHTLCQIEYVGSGPQHLLFPTHHARYHPGAHCRVWTNHASFPVL